MSTPKQVRDDVVTAINALTAVTARSVTAVGAWVLTKKREEITGLEIVVAPDRREGSIQGRGGQKIDDLTIGVSIFEPLGSDPDAVAEGLQLIADNIIAPHKATPAGLLGGQLSGASAAVCLAAVQTVVMDVDQWRENRIARTIIELTYRA